MADPDLVSGGVRSRPWLVVPHPDDGDGALSTFDEAADALRTAVARRSGAAVDQLPPDGQYDHRADNRADQARRLAGLVEVQKLPDPGEQRRAQHAQQRRQQAALRVARVARDEAREQPRDEADDDGGD